MLEKSHRQIEDSDGNLHEYEVDQFPARLGLQYKKEIADLVGPIFKGNNDAEVGAAVSELISNLNYKKIEKLIFSLLSQTLRDGQELNGPNFDKFYAGNYDELFKALEFILEVNYSSFLGYLTSRIGSQKGGNQTSQTH